MNIVIENNNYFLESRSNLTKLTAVIVTINSSFVNYVINWLCFCDARFCLMFIKFVYVIQAKVWGPLPFVMLGGSALLSMVLYLFLPETLGHPMFDTIEQAERYHNE